MGARIGGRSAKSSIDVNGRAKMQIALVGAGEMGSAVGARLRERGADVVTSLRGRSPASAERVRRAGLRVVEGERELIEGAQFVLSIVPPARAAEVARGLAGVITEAPQKPAYVDCNAISPHSAGEIAQILRPTGCRFIDAGIIGSPPRAGYDGPKIYATGGAAPELAQLADFGLNVRVLAGDVGVASALKMSYAGITKGFTGVAAAMMLAGSRAGVGAELRRELEESQPQLFAWMSRQVPSMYPKAYRWVAEMEEIAAFSRDDAPTRALYESLAAFYEEIASLYAGRNASSDPFSSLSEFVGGRR
jgi:L-threonate 2-dehydrogenase